MKTRLVSVKAFWFKVKKERGRGESPGGEYMRKEHISGDHKKNMLIKIINKAQQLYKKMHKKRAAAEEKKKDKTDKPG